MRIFMVQPAACRLSRVKFRRRERRVAPSRCVEPTCRSTRSIPLVLPRRHWDIRHHAAFPSSSTHPRTLPCALPHIRHHGSSGSFVKTSRVPSPHALFFFWWYASHLELHSFPTRRSAAW